MIFQKVKKYKINKFDKNLKKVLKIITNKDEIFNLKCQRCKKIKNLIYIKVFLSIITFRKFVMNVTLIFNN